MPVQEKSLLKRVVYNRLGMFMVLWTETVVNQVLCSSRLPMIQSFQSFVLHPLQHQETNQTDEKKRFNL